MQLMKTGNMDVTRTHTTPWNKLWMRAADKMELVLVLKEHGLG